MSFIATNGKIDLTQKIINVSDMEVNISKVIPLETTNRSIVGEINNLFINRSGIWIADQLQANAVYKFGLDGSFIKKMKRIGKAEGEYISLGSFFQLSKNRGCAICDRGQKKILFFDNNLDFIKESALNQRFFSIASVGDQFLIQTTPDQENYIELLDANFNKQQGLIHRPKCVYQYYSGTLDRLKVDYSTNSVTYNPPLTNAIYQWKDGEVKLKYAINNIELFPNINFFKENQGMHPVKMFQKISKQKYLTVIDFIETDDKLLLKYLMEGEKMVTIYDKQSEKSETVRIGNNLIGNLLYNSRCVINKNLIVSYIYPCDLHKYKDSIEKESKKFSTVSVDDNACIVLLKL
ncbi:6-bladed beta-propeller [Halosquirtibacter xylanolyticus]|uniref:6-bladed beta-propeller n=1 Tax=Halosquirtibacter xylanolyticus TaxID=3374599 RepID=UPI003749303B|nr:6-bladed beta-propeller [Prolixibacteraceae bacterium]